MNFKIIYGLIITLFAVPTFALQRAKRIMGHVPAVATASVRRPMHAMPVSADTESKEIKATQEETVIDDLLAELTADEHPLYKAYYESPQAFKKAVEASAARGELAQDVRHVKQKYKISLLALAKKEKRQDAFDVLTQALGAGELVYAALQKGDFTTAKKLTETTTIDMNGRYGPDEENLLFAINPSTDSVPMIAYLLDHGIDVDVHDARGVTMLELAVIRGEFDVVRLLCSRGATLTDEIISLAVKHRKVLMYLMMRNLDASYSAEYKALESACYEGYLEGVVCLLELGLDVNRTYKWLQSPLMIALDRLRNFTDKKKYEDVVEYLIDSGANVRATDSYGITVLDYAVRSGSLRAVQLVARALVAQGLYGHIERAMKLADGEILNYLLAMNQDSSCQAEYAALLHAITMEDFEKVKFFIGTVGLDVNKKDTSGKTPLMAACSSHSDNAVLLYLIAQGADVTARDNEGKTVLMYAAESGYAVSIIMEAVGFDKAVLNAQDNKGYTALMYACIRSPIEVVEYLIGQGADIYKVQKLKPTLRHRIALIAHKVVGSACLIAAAHGNRATVEYLIGIVQEDRRKYQEHCVKAFSAALLVSSL